MNEKDLKKESNRFLEYHKEHTELLSKDLSEILYSFGILIYGKIYEDGFKDVANIKDLFYKN